MFYTIVDEDLCVVKFLYVEDGKNSAEEVRAAALRKIEVYLNEEDSSGGTFTVIEDEYGNLDIYNRLNGEYYMDWSDGDREVFTPICKLTVDRFVEYNIIDETL